MQGDGQGVCEGGVRQGCDWIHFHGAPPNAQGPCKPFPSHGVSGLAESIARKERELPGLLGMSGLC